MKRIIISAVLALFLSMIFVTSVALAAGPVTDVTVEPGIGPANVIHGEDAGRPDVDVITPIGDLVPPDEG